MFSTDDRDATQPDVDRLALFYIRLGHPVLDSLPVGGGRFYRVSATSPCGRAPGTPDRWQLSAVVEGVEHGLANYPATSVGTDRAAALNAAWSGTGWLQGRMTEVARQLFAAHLRTQDGFPNDGRGWMTRVPAVGGGQGLRDYWRVEWRDAEDRVLDHRGGFAKGVEDLYRAIDVVEADLARRRREMEIATLAYEEPVWIGILDEEACRDLALGTRHVVFCEVDDKREHRYRVFYLFGIGQVDFLLDCRHVVARIPVRLAERLVQVAHQYAPYTTTTLNRSSSS